MHYVGGIELGVIDVFYYLFLLAIFSYCSTSWERKGTQKNLWPTFLDDIGLAVLVYAPEIEAPSVVVPIETRVSFLACPALVLVENKAFD